MGLFGKNKEEAKVEEEQKTPDNECAFQFGFDEGSWQCALVPDCDEFFCDKTKCPFWRK